MGKENVARDNETKRAVRSAVWRGLLGRCPRCGKGRLLTGYIAPVTACAVCGEDLAPYRTADFAPYLVVFVVGLIFTPLTIAISTRQDSDSAAIVLILAAAVAMALVLLPRAKGVAIALLWALGVQSNQ
jgi:uncharacterized protein (DUF983 family)